MAFVAAISAAGGSTLIANGAMSPAPIVKTDFANYVESLPAFAVIALMACTYNIGIGIAAGFILDALCKPRWIKPAKSRPDYALGRTVGLVLSLPPASLGRVIAKRLSRAS